MHFIQTPTGRPSRIRISVWSFFYALSVAVSFPLANTGRGLRSRKSKWRNNRWHCRTPTRMLYSCSIQVESVLPSHKFTRIPTSLGVARKTRSTASVIFGAQSSGPTRLALLPSSQPGRSFKAAHPILNRAWCIPQQPCHVRARHALGHQQHSMEAMIVARFLRSRISSCNPITAVAASTTVSGLMSSRKPHPDFMRNYLCRYV